MLGWSHNNERFNYIMSFTVEQKSQLAKLMATENLTIEHQKIQTAKFDVKNRVLYLPIWQNMTGHLYDLLCGHEVGHALYTPAEGWHDAALDKTKNKNYKAFLNVVEDARIEKKIKRKYPGLNQSFTMAYGDLIARDFFGLKGRDINDMAFIERLNLYTKSQYAMPIRFTAEEQVMVEKVKKAETWDDVVAIVNEIYAYSKDEQAELDQFQDFEYANDDDFGDNDLENDGEGADENAESNQESQAKQESESKDDGENDIGDNTSNKINHDKDSKEAEDDQYFDGPSCETDDNYRKNESLLLDEKSKNYGYYTFPKPNLKEIITPAKVVHGLMTKSFDDQIKSGLFSELYAAKLVRDFKLKNEKYVSLLAKEFEMRKAAKSYSKAKISDTGDIDINKLSTYRFDDNIFRKLMVVPKGKSHGLILLLDCSGSMSQNMAGSIEQILILSMFCRKVNISFEVYGFGDSTSNYVADKKFQGLDASSYDTRRNCFTLQKNDVALRTVQLREYLNSKMSNAEFTKCLKNLVLLKQAYESRSTRYGLPMYDEFGNKNNAVYRPDSEQLSNTPLIQAICASREVMLEFRKKNNLDLSSLVIVHDGDADNNTRYATGDDSTNPYNMESIDTYNTNVSFVDKKYKYQFKVNSEKLRLSYYDYMLEATLDWFSKTTNSKVFGFFIVPPSPSNIKSVVTHRYFNAQGKTVFDIEHDLVKAKEFKHHSEIVKEIVKDFRAEKLLVSNNPGYNKFFMIIGGKDLITEDDEIEIEGKVTSNKLKTAFMKFNKKRLVNRVLVNKFIEGIAA